MKTNLLKSVVWRIVLSIVCAAVVVVCLVLWLKPSREVEDDSYELSERISKVRQRDGSYSLVNTETGKVLLNDIECDWIQEGRDSLAVFSKDDKRGYFNANTGEIVISPTYKHAWVFSEGLAGVVKNNMVGFINSRGETVIDFVYPYRGNSLVDFVFHDGRCVVANTDQKIGVIDTLGNWVIQPIYDDICLNKEYAVVGKKGEFNQQIDFDGNILNELVIDNVYELHYDVPYVDKTTGCPSSATVKHPDYYEYKVGYRSGLMTSDGEFITKPIYSSIRCLSENVFSAVLLDGYSEVLINRQGKVLSRMK